MKWHRKAEQEITPEAAIVPQTEAAPTPAALAPVTAAQFSLIQQADAEIARLRQQRREIDHQASEQNAEIATINRLLQAAAAGVDELARLQARRAALWQAIANLGREGQRLEREIDQAGKRRQQLAREREYGEGLRDKLRGEAFDQRLREQKARAEALQAAELAEQAEAQLRSVTARLEQLGEVPVGSRS